MCGVGALRMPAPRNAFERARVTTRYMVGKALRRPRAQAISYNRGRLATLHDRSAAPSQTAQEKPLKFQPDTLDGVNNITRYDVDNLRVNADLHTKSVLVPWVGAAQDWDATRVEELTPAHFDALLAFDPEVVIFGSGAEAEVRVARALPQPDRQAHRRRDDGQRRRLPHLHRARQRRPARGRGNPADARGLSSFTRRKQALPALFSCDKSGPSGMPQAARPGHVGSSLYNRWLCLT